MTNHSHKSKPEEPLYTQATAPLFQSFTAFKLDKSPNKSSDDLIEEIKANFPSITEESVDDRVGLYYYLKNPNRKLTHKERIEILVKVLNCNEADAIFYYKEMKIRIKIRKFRKAYQAYAQQIWSFFD